MLATWSGWVRSLNGISGREANRISITQNPASSTIPARIGPSASPAPGPRRPASTTP